MTIGGNTTGSIPATADWDTFKAELEAIQGADNIGGARSVKIDGSSRFWIRQRRQTLVAAPTLPDPVQRYT